MAVASLQPGSLLSQAALSSLFARAASPHRDIHPFVFRSQSLVSRRAAAEFFTLCQGSARLALLGASPLPPSTLGPGARVGSGHAANLPLAPRTGRAGRPAGFSQEAVRLTPLSPARPRSSGALPRTRGSASAGWPAPHTPTAPGWRALRQLIDTSSLLKYCGAFQFRRKPQEPFCFSLSAHSLSCGHRRGPCLPMLPGPHPEPGHAGTPRGTHQRAVARHCGTPAQCTTALRCRG